MLRYVPALVALAFLVGCESGPALSKGPSSDEQAKLAAFAATADFPSNMKASSDLQAAAVLKGDKITIRNFSDQTLQNAKVWVNGAYVRQVDVIPAHGSVTIDRGQFYNKAGLPLSTDQVTVNQVQLQTQDGKLYTLQGPQME